MTSTTLSVLMNSAIRLSLAISLILFSLPAASAEPFVELLKKRIQESGYKSPSRLNSTFDSDLAAVGKSVFESEHLSLTSDISCVTCHIDTEGSADGLPVSAAIGGIGEGIGRFHSGAKLLPRNSIALWGRGAKGFNAFFWDGKVVVDDKRIVSQFGSRVPDDDPLVVAIHLPVVEIREMVDESEFIKSKKLENVDAAYDVYDEIAKNIERNDPLLAETVAAQFGVKIADVTFLHYAKSISEFFRERFKIQPTKLSRFMESDTPLSQDEVKGGLLFYGRGGCSICHNGPHFSDFEFYSVPFRQLGFGKNGFGVDYGRYNVTFDPGDLYTFRTAPLWNVERTSPYGHSGSVTSLEDAIRAHFDPLSLIDLQKLSVLARHELFKRFARSREVAASVGYLTNKEVDHLAAFLRALTFAGQ